MVISAVMILSIRITVLLCEGLGRGMFPVDAAKVIKYMAKTNENL